MVPWLFFDDAGQLDQIESIKYIFETPHCCNQPSDDDCIYGEAKEKANTHRDALRITVKKMRNIEKIPARDIAIFRLSRFVLAKW